MDDTIFLTDGRTFIGPYLSDDVTGRVSGTRTLREVHGASNVWVVAAADEAQARTAFQRPGART